MSKHTFPEEKIKQAFQELEAEHDEILEKLYNIADSDSVNSGEAMISKRFDRKMLRMIRSNSLMREMRSISKAAVFIIAVLGSGVIGITVYAVLSNLRLTSNEIDTRIKLEPEIRSEIIDIYTPDLLPEGLELSSVEISETLIVTRYEGENGEMEITQQLATVEYSHDNEEVETIVGKALETEVTYFLKNETGTLYFTYDGYLFEIYTYPVIDFEVMLKVVESFESTE